MDFNEHLIKSKKLNFIMIGVVLLLIAIVIIIFCITNINHKCQPEFPQFHDPIAQRIYAATLFNNSVDVQKETLQNIFETYKITADSLLIDSLVHRMFNKYEKSLKSSTE